MYYYHSVANDFSCQRLPYDTPPLGPTLHCTTQFRHLPPHATKTIEQTVIGQFQFIYTRRSHERFVRSPRLRPSLNTCKCGCTPLPVPVRVLVSVRRRTCVSTCTCNYTCCVHVDVSAAALVSTADRVKCCVLWPANVAVESVSVTSSSRNWPKMYRTAQQTCPDLALHFIREQVGAEAGAGAGDGTRVGAGVVEFQRAAYNLINKVAKMLVALRVLDYKNALYTWECKFQRIEKTMHKSMANRRRERKREVVNNIFLSKIL